jgi:predicted ATPase/DNA-binding XRE family transcriptional regulator
MERRMGRPTPVTFGQLLRRYRHAAGITQEALAEHAGVSARAIAYIEHDQRVPFPDTARRLAVTLDLSSSDRARLLAAARPNGDAVDYRVADAGQLPRPITELIGREQDVARLGVLLTRPGVRLVTLTGTGGVGKTRLAIQVASDVAGAFTGGTHFVALAGLREPGMVIPTIAQTLGLRETRDESLSVQLAAYLKERETLLLLDNFEHVGTAATELAALLAVCSRLVVLVTSRAPLHLQGEHEWPVAPLIVPRMNDALSVDALGKIGAVALFVQRGHAIRPNFSLTELNAAAIAAICRELDGLPLALELAAARLRVLSPEALLIRLERKLPLLTGGSMDLPERQRTLRGAIALSYELLQEEERSLLRRLAVFAGGATLEAAEAVCGRAEATGVELLDQLSALIDHGLVQVSAASDRGEPRYGLLAAVREFGLEQLEATASCGYSELDAARDRHLAWCVRLAEESTHAARTSGRHDALERLEAERDNLQAALIWSAQADPGRGGDQEALLRLATALAPFWVRQGPLSEGRRWLEAALASNITAPLELRLRALAAVGRLAASQGDAEAARHWFGECLAGCRAVNDRYGMATALTGLGQLVSLVGDGGSVQYRAEDLLEEALALWRELGDKVGAARALNGLSKVATTYANYEISAALLGESLSLLRELGDAPGIAEALLRLGECFLDQGDTTQATAMFDEHLTWTRALGDPIMLASALLTRGELAMRLGQFAEAEALMTESLAHSRKADARIWIGGALHRSGILAAWQGHFEQAEARVGEALDLMRPLLGKGIVDFAGALGKLAWITCLHGKHERAVKLAQDYLAMLRESDGCCNMPDGLMILGCALHTSGDMSGARAVFLESLSLVHHGRKSWYDKVTIAHDLAGLARMAAARGQLERAVKLYGAGETCRATGPFPLAPPEEAVRDQVLDEARAGLGEAGFAAAWAEGQMMPLEDAITLALADCDTVE